MTPERQTVEAVVEEKPATAHVHAWKATGLVIDTFPEQRTYRCECGAATHDPETGVICNIGHFA